MISSCVTINKEESICGRDEGHVLRGIPCGPIQLCQPQTAVGMCTCTLGWAVSESIVGIV